MPELLKAPVTPAQQARDTLLGALVGLARATTSEPKTDDTDEVLNAGLRLAAQPDAPEERLQRMLAIVQTEKHRVAPAAPPVPCPAATRTITILSACGCAREYPHPQAANAFCRVCAGPKAPAGQAQAAVYQLLFTLAEDWNEELLAPVVQRAKELCRE